MMLRCYWWMRPMRIFRFSLHCLVAINTGINVCPALEGDCRLFSSPPTVPWCPGTSINFHAAALSKKKPSSSTQRPEVAVRPQETKTDSRMKWVCMNVETSRLQLWKHQYLWRERFGSRLTRYSCLGPLGQSLLILFFFCSLCFFPSPLESGVVRPIWTDSI